MAQTAFFGQEDYGGPWWQFRSPYNPDFPALLKNAASLSTWNPEEKCWRIHEDQLDDAIEVAKKFWEVEVEE